MEATLTPMQARQSYKRKGWSIELAGHYEHLAFRRVLAHAQFESAQTVFELGCGTGAIAQRLLEKHLPQTARYRAIDVTPEMVQRTQRRLDKFGPRARISLSDGSPPTAEPTLHYDRFVSNYVLDLLSAEHITAMLHEAYRMLQPGGLLCLTGMAPGRSPSSRLLVGIWSTLYRMNPSWVGGCRHMELLPFIDEQRWRIRHHEVVARHAFPLEALVAEKRS